MKIALIIPFFQRESGLLKRAIISAIEGMNGVGQNILHIIIVDDSSPISAASELEEFKTGNDQITIRILNQTNKGPGGARNSGLDSLDSSIDIVTFLDSDDTWSHDHIQRICEAFTLGADFYFADHKRISEPLSRFAECSFNATHEKSIISDMYVCTSSIFFETLSRSPIGTSTVAYRFSKYMGLRFAENFRAGEDILFWLEIVSQSPQIFYSTKIEALYGRGVNIFHGVKWGTFSDLVRLYDSAQFHRAVVTRFTLDERCLKLNAEHCRRIDQSFAMSLFSALKHNEKSVLAVAKNYFKLRPQFIFSVPAAILKLIQSALDRRP